MPMVIAKIKIIPGFIHARRSEYCDCYYYMYALFIVIVTAAAVLHRRGLGWGGAGEHAC